MKIFVKFLPIVLLFQFQAFAQNPDKSALDSLYKQFLSGRFEQIVPVTRPGQTRVLPIKCGTFLAYEVRKNFSQFTIEQQAVLKPLLTRPVKDTSIVTPAKLFRIHYDKTGYDAPKYSLTELAKALDSSFNFEVNHLKYLAPPKDNGLGGDDLYDVYISNLGNDYGYTQFNSNDDEVSPGSQTYRSYMEIDDDYGDGFPTNGIEGARVTVAHEFHHAIQLGSYIFREEDRYFLELTSTSMEDFVFSSINDYLNYLPTFFQNPNRSFGRNLVKEKGDGYDLAIWHFFLQKKFGFDIIRLEWDYLKNYRAIEAVDKALQDYNTTFIEAYNEFGIWCYYTNYRTVPGKYFDDAAYYPVLNPFYALDFFSPSKTVSFNSPAASNTFLYFVNAPQIDTLMVICTNGDVPGALANATGANYPCEYSLYDFSNLGAVKIGGNYYNKMITNTSVWMQSQILNNEIANGQSNSLPNVDFPFPSPFVYSKNLRVYFPITNTDLGLADLNIYNSSMSLVYSTSQMIEKYIDKKVIKWNCKDNSGNKLSSGVYVYAIKTKNSTITGKLAIINN